MIWVPCHLLVEVAVGLTVNQLSSRSTSCWQALMEMLTSFPCRIHHLPTVPILPNAWLIMLLLWLTSQPIHATRTPQTVKKKTINTWPKNTDELKAKKATWSPACHAAWWSILHISIYIIINWVYKLTHFWSLQMGIFTLMIWETGFLIWWAIGYSHFTLYLY